MTDEWTEADDVIEEIWEIRRRMWAEFDYDVEKMGAYFMELDEKYEGRMVDTPAEAGSEKSSA